MKENTAQAILDVAQELVCTRGYSAFSYADISEKVGIRKASIHYHFPSKEDLTRELVRRYRYHFQQTLNRIGQQTTQPSEQLALFCNIYRERLNPERVCLAGMLLADFRTLPEIVQTEVAMFFSDAETWLTNVLAEGQAQGDFSSNFSAEKKASSLLATVHGAQLLARASGRCKALFDAVVEELLASL